MSWNRLHLVTPPTGRVLTLDEAKAQCRVEVSNTDDDDYLTGLIAAAEAYIDGPRGIGVAMLTQGWRLSFDQWETPLAIPLGPVQAVTGITYTDMAGATQTLDPAAYIADLEHDPVWITRAWNKVWPVARFQAASIKVNFTAGFGDDAASVPQDLKHAMLLLIAHWYANREAVVGVENRDSSTELPLGVSALLDRWRCGMVA